MFGLIENMSFKDYRANPAMNKSSLDKIAKSPAHFKWFQEHPEEQTPAMEFGSAFHDYVLLPATFGQNYVVSPGFDRRTTQGKTAHAAFAALNIGKTVLSKDDMADLEAMRLSILANEAAAALLAAGRPEVSCFWKDDATGIDCKARADLFIPETNTLVDLKTSQDGSFSGFQRSIANFRYHCQASWYQTGFSNFNKIDNFVFIVVEKSAPFAVAIYVLDEASIEKGKEVITNNLSIYAECSKKNEWPSYTKEPTLINLPSYAF